MNADYAVVRDLAILKWIRILKAGDLVVFGSLWSCLVSQLDLC